jgi:hypothetical protein
MLSKSSTAAAVSSADTTGRARTTFEEKLPLTRAVYTLERSRVTMW